MGQMDISNSNQAQIESEKAQVHDNQPMKGFKDISGNFQFIKVANSE